MFINWQLDYDSLYCYWRASQFLASRNPTLAEQCRVYALAQMDPSVYEYLPNPTYPTPREGSLATQADMDLYGGFGGWWNQIPGWFIYNLGARMLAVDGTLSAEVQEKYRLITVNYGRQTAPGNMFDLLWWKNSQNNDTWPSATTDTDPTWPAGAREFALALLAHLVADDWFSEFEDRVYTGDFGINTYLWAHDELMDRIVWRYYLAPNAVVDTWQRIHADLTAAGEDWSLVPDIWDENNYNANPFMMTHAMRALIFAFEDPVFTNDYNTAIQQAVTDVCDMCLTHWQKTTLGGNTCIAMTCYSGAVPTPAADLSYWYFPMFAWAWSKTGTQAYYDMAIDLITTGNAEHYWQPGKHFNQATIWMWHGIQWMGWAPSDPFTTFWRE